MKVAVSALGENLSSQVDMRFGRAKKIIVVDSETMTFKVIENTINANAMQGAGIQTAEKIIEFGVDSVITGNIGPKALKILNLAGIKVFLSEKSSVLEAIDALQTGKLAIADSANVDS